MNALKFEYSVFFKRYSHVKRTVDSLFSRIRYTKTVCDLGGSKNIYTTSDEQQYMTYDTMSLFMKQTLS